MKQKKNKSAIYNQKRPSKYGFIETDLVPKNQTRFCIYAATHSLMQLYHQCSMMTNLHSQWIHIKYML